jgi:molybdenum cofactor synthesis domain-containing protein
VLTISTTRSGGGAEDESGPRLAELAGRLGATDVHADLVRDDRRAIEERLRELCDRDRCALVLTTGGTGLTDDDVTPEATRAVLDREIPGIGEAIRAASREHTEHWMLSRAIAGTRGRTLIVNFPGSPRAIDELAGALEGGLRHALALVSGAGHARHAAGA